MDNKNIQEGDYVRTTGSEVYKINKNSIAMVLEVEEDKAFLLFSKNKMPVLLTKRLSTLEKVDKVSVEITSKLEAAKKIAMSIKEDWDNA